MSDASRQLLTGIVTRAEIDRYDVQIGNETIPCVLRGKLRKAASRATRPVVVGDEVVVSREPGAPGQIESVKPRRTVLSRPGSSYDRREHVIAANVDLLVVVSSAHSPPFRRHLVERYLVLASRGRMDAVLVVNKCDIADPRLVMAWTEPLRATGLTVIPVSTVTGEGLPELQQLLRGRVAVLAGQSGVGKSSLAMALCPELRLRTQDVNTHQRGRHTTTASAMYALPGRGFLVDTPGIKTLAMFAPEADDYALAFPEIEALADGCRFRNCTHDHEPGCAVKAALARGELTPSRYENFLRLRRDE